MMKTPIILLHGLGCHSTTLIPLEMYLNYIGWKNTHRLSYPADTLKFNEMIDYVDKEIEKVADRENEIILIGQSMGGLVSNNLHRKGWNIKHAVYIGSPLHGARFINKLDEYLPNFIKNIFYKDIYNFLRNKDNEEHSPHAYTTISTGWLCSDFDGCVYKHETMLDEENHIHIPFSDHRLIIVDPRLWYEIGKLL